MAEPFLGEIRLVAFDFAPRGWALCQGQLLPIAQNAALFSIIGTTYGGDGRVTFALPDLRGRVPAHMGPDLLLGEATGAEAVTLLQTEIPSHGHRILAADTTGESADPTGRYPARTRVPHYAENGAATSMPNGAAGTVGGSQPHNNLSPVLVLNFAIALQGIFPQRA